MQIPPPISYVERAGGDLAYQVFGEGSIDIVTVADPPSHLDLLWTDPGYVDVLLRLAGITRPIMYDRRGVGLSDPLEHVPTLEEEALDLEAVMDAAGSERAVVFGYGASNGVAAYFAATRPERVTRLVLQAPTAAGWESDTEGWEPEELEAARRALADALSHWGEGRFLDLWMPRIANPRSRRLWGMLERASASRAAARAIWRRATESDLTDVLPSVQAPTLVMRHEDNLIPTAAVARVADLIPFARYREVRYAGVRPIGVADYWIPMVDEIEEFITGTRGGEARQRTFATILFTDIVDSTAHAAMHGDTRWRELLADHDAVLAGLVDEEGGRLIKNVGDGSLSSFDGPVRAIRCAQRLSQAVEPMGVEIRAGVHAGDVERVGLDVAGIAVHVGARVQAAAEPGEVLVTAAARELSHGSGVEFHSRGGHELKGVPGEWDLYAVTGDRTVLELTAESEPLRVSDRVVLAAARRAPGLLRGVAGMRG